MPNPVAPEARLFIIPPTDGIPGLGGIVGDDGLGVVRIEVRDHELGLDGPDELHAPDGVVGAWNDEALRIHLLGRAIERALVEGEGREDRAIRCKFVRLDGVIDVFLDEGRNDRDHVPRAHEAL